MPTRRVHVVLVPGFAGFDALGQLEYYSGVTPLFRAWRNGYPAVLHYFDNFPTANVATRAKRLARYLAKRIARGEFAEDDALVLVGHSTGGLDIRQMVRDCDEAKKPFRVDSDEAIDPLAILEGLARGGVVFLSVPQHGTNIADWVRARRVERNLVLANARGAVGIAQWPLIDVLPDTLVTGAAIVSRSGAACALQDALDEIDTSIRVANLPGPDDARYLAAEAREAAALMELWLGHMQADFGAIDDLAAAPQPDNSPARWPDRRRERERWSALGLRTRSYATRARRLFGFRPGPLPEPWNPLTAWQDAALMLPGAAELDLLHLACYRACASGPFRVPEDAPLQAAAWSQGIEPWDNDGIVNTASMYWPDYGATRLVEADHMDIVGHYQARALINSPTGRRYDRYDLLGSGCGFDDAAFTKVWTTILDDAVAWA